MGILNFFFQQDNDPKHASELTKRVFFKNNVEFMQLSAQSSDMSPIKNIWTPLKNGIMDKNPKNIAELKSAVKSVKESITPQITGNYALSFKKRGKELYRAKGWSINN